MACTIWSHARFGCNNTSFIREVRCNCLHEIKGQSTKYSKWNSGLKEYEKLEFYGESKCKLCERTVAKCRTED